MLEELLQLGVAILQLLLELLDLGALAENFGVG